MNPLTYGSGCDFRALKGPSEWHHTPVRLASGCSHPEGNQPHPEVTGGLCEVHPQRGVGVAPNQDVEEIHHDLPCRTTAAQRQREAHLDTTLRMNNEKRCRFLCRFLLLSCACVPTKIWRMTRKIGNATNLQQICI